MYDQIAACQQIAPGQTNLGLTSTGTQFNWVSTITAVRIIAIACTVTQDATVSPPTLGFYHRPTAGNNTGRVLIGQLGGVLGSWIRGNTIWKYVNPRIVKPGEDVLFSVDVAAGGGASGHPHFLFDPMWDISGISGRIFQF